jgi:LmbE family N-acetylglucosaminyl deacetylase
VEEVTVFLLPHQDDEFGVFFAIEQAARSGARPICVYLTDGGGYGHDPARRNAESLRVLRQLGVGESDVYFTGADEGYKDGLLYTRLDDAVRAIAPILERRRGIRALYLPAWEGGHQDHDAGHLIGAVLAAKGGLLPVARQFGLYRATDNLLGMAAVLPLMENGPIDSAPIPLGDRRRYLRLALFYVSQWKTWAVLLPMLAYAYSTRGAQQTQPLSLSRLAERPHKGALLYERRGQANYHPFRTAADEFLRRSF